MDRREFIVALAMLATPLAAGGRQPRTVPRIGYLSPCRPQAARCVACSMISAKGCGSLATSRSRTFVIEPRPRMNPVKRTQA
jgi:hypothetical protein